MASDETRSSAQHRAGDLAPSTVAITAGRPKRRPDGPLNEPVVFASTFHAGGPVAYGRDGNPTWTALEDALGALEGGTALVFASGMAATMAVLDEVPVGGVVVAPSHAYYGTRNLLTAAPEGRFTVRFVDIADTDATLAACDCAHLLLVESPTNPLLEVADLSARCAGAHDRDVLVAVDNTFATPLGQRPLDHGADVVLHSVTKFLAGHSDVILGATVTNTCDLRDRLRQRRSRHGAIPGPMEAFLALRGLRTLALRYERAQANAQKLARQLRDHPMVERVRYPGLTSDAWYERAAAQMRCPYSSSEIEPRAKRSSRIARAGAPVGFPPMRLRLHAPSAIPLTRTTTDATIPVAVAALPTSIANHLPAIGCGARPCVGGIRPRRVHPGRIAHRGSAVRPPTTAEHPGGARR